MLSLPAPQLEARQLDSLHIVTDDALARTTGVRVAFTGRVGGVSKAPYDSLNLGSHVGDDLEAVEENRRILLRALGAEGAALVVPNQVHGTDLVEVSGALGAASVEVGGEYVPMPVEVGGELGASVEVEYSGDFASALERATSSVGADGIVVSVPRVAALLCFADCAPVVVVSPTGRFAVAHAGWRGAVAGIASKAARAVAQADVSEGAFAHLRQALSSYNAYIGPHIHAECFETGADVRDRFFEAYGAACIADERHVSLARAIEVDLVGAGMCEERIVDAGVCTVCSHDEFYSYRASGGSCGRHGAIAVRLA